MKKSYILRELFIFFLTLLSIGCLLYSAMYLLIAILNINDSLTSASMIGFSFLSASLLSFLLIKRIRKHETSRNLKTLSSLKNKLFQPDKDLEIYRWKRGQYIGFDDKNKTIIALNLYNNPPIAKAVDFNSWSGYECRGNIITFKFDDINFPSFVMRFRSESESMSFCHKLDVLLSPKYKSQSGFGEELSQYVKDRLQTV